MEFDGLLGAANSFPATRGRETLAFAAGSAVECPASDCWQRKGMGSARTLGTFELA
jgi:hypothetical protein